MTRLSGISSALLAATLCLTLAGCQSRTTVVEPVKEVPEHHDPHQNPPPPPPPPPHRDDHR